MIGAALSLWTVLAAPPNLGTAEVPPGPNLPAREPGLPTTLFVNFDGGVLRAGCGNDPHLDCSSLAHLFDGYVGPFEGSDNSRAAILQAVRKDLADFGVAVTAVRPPDDQDYDMVMYGNLGEQTFAGVAPYIDCGNQWPSDTSFSAQFTSSNTGSTVILQEAAHTWGLEHVFGQEDLLHPIAEGAAPDFRDECLKIVSNTEFDETPGICNTIHERFCEPGFQNSYQEVLYLFGPAVPDTSAPQIELLAPIDGSVHALPSVVEFRTRVIDDRHPQDYTYTVFLAGEPIFEETRFGEFDFTFVVDQVGEYDVTVRVADEAGNTGEARTRFELVEAGSLDTDLDIPNGCGIGSTGRDDLLPLLLLPLLALRRRRS